MLFYYYYLLYLKEISLDNNYYFNKCLNRVKEISIFGIILFPI